MWIAEMLIGGGAETVAGAMIIATIVSLVLVGVAHLMEKNKE